MKQFRLNERPFSVPQAWPELTEPQLLAVVPHLYADRRSARVRLAVLQLLCPVPRKLLRLLGAEQLRDLLQLVEWVWEQELVATALTSFPHRGRTYLLPLPRLEDAVALEYALASMHFAAFAHPQRPQPQRLDDLVAALCRPQRADLDETDPHWDGQRRERFNPKLAEARAKELAGAPMAVKIVVLQQFLSAQRFIHRAYQELYKRQEQGARRGQPVVSDGSEVMELIHVLAQEGTYGDYDATCYTSMHTILYNQAKQAKRRREQEQDE
ncbi:hypothetical protein GCM10027048_20490 [Hymenobacter coalescens]